MFLLFIILCFFLFHNPPKTETEKKVASHGHFVAVNHLIFNIFKQAPSNMVTDL